jgi:hypothetical protein
MNPTDTLRNALEGWGCEMTGGCRTVKTNGQPCRTCEALELLDTHVAVPRETVEWAIEEIGKLGDEYTRLRRTYEPPYIAYASYSVPGLRASLGGANPE